MSHPRPRADHPIARAPAARRMANNGHKASAKLRRRLLEHRTTVRHPSNHTSPTSDVEKSPAGAKSRKQIRRTRIVEVPTSQNSLYGKLLRSQTTSTDSLGRA